MLRVVYTLIIVMALGSVILLAGCGHKTASTPAVQPVTSPQSTPEGMEVQVPTWFSKPPEDPNYLYATATIKSTDLGFANEQAVQAARDELARQITTRVTNMMKRFQEETGSDEDAEFLSMMTIVSKSVAAESISGSKAIEKKIYKEGTKSFRAYALVELPIGVANESMLEKIKNNKNMYTRFRATQAFQELEDEVQKYEEFKKQQQQGGTNP